jgi:hypothetical protein
MADQRTRARLRINVASGIQCKPAEADRLNLVQGVHVVDSSIRFRTLVSDAVIRMSIRDGIRA